MDDNFSSNSINNLIDGGIASVSKFRLTHHMFSALICVAGISQKCVLGSMHINVNTNVQFTLNLLEFYSLGETNLHLLLFSLFP